MAIEARAFREFSRGRRIPRGLAHHRRVGVVAAVWDDLDRQRDGY
jgi:hypothetical protein